MTNRCMVDVMTRRVASRLSRVSILTGARQTGKTTLLRHVFGEWPYLSFDDPAVRTALTQLTSAQWFARHPRAVLDEVQKAPLMMEIIKAVHDAEPSARYVLSGSSQILLMPRTRETLAGRVSVDELWPLTLPELATEAWGDSISPSRWVQWLRTFDAAAIDGVPASDAGFGVASVLLDRYLTWGGMPALVDRGLGDDDRRQWLRDYRRTYLERDVIDLASLRDLEPFVRTQEALAHRSGSIVNFADLARVTGVSHPTAQRFLRYLELSYQVIVLQPYFRNPEKRLAKQPKVHVIDPGIWRAITGHWGPLSGSMYESAVVGELIKQIRNAGIEARLHHLRTADGREVDLLVELEAGFVAIEIKQAARIEGPDARHLRTLDGLLDRPLLAAFVLSNDPTIKTLAPGVTALPVAWLLGPEHSTPSRVW